MTNPMKKNVDYIVLSELPREQQIAFMKWWQGGTVPVVYAEKENKHSCVYKEDYDWFLKSLKPPEKMTDEEIAKDFLRFEKEWAAVANKK